MMIVQIGSVHGHPFQCADFFRFAPAKLFSILDRRSFVTRPLSGAADHRGDIENIVRFVTSNDRVGAEETEFWPVTRPQAAHRALAVLRDRSRAGWSHARLIARPRCSRPAGRSRGWAGWRVAEPLTG